MLKDRLRSARFLDCDHCLAALYLDANRPLADVPRVFGWCRCCCSFLGHGLGYGWFARR